MIAVMIGREWAGREPSPSAGVLDSKTVKDPAAGAKRGYDGAKRTAKFQGGRKRYPWLRHLFADSAYDRGRLMDKATYLDFTLEVIRRIEGEPGFKVLPRRWVDERTFA